MTERVLIHIAGPAGAGKTTFIERLLEAEIALASSVRAERDPSLRRERESAPRSHAELRRYRAAGAIDCARYRFGEPDAEAFFASRIMESGSDIVFIEGDCPTEFADFSVFVAPPPRPGRSVLDRVIRDRSAEVETAIDELDQVLQSPEECARLFSGGLGEPFVAMALARPAMLEGLRRSLKAKLAELRRAPPPAPTEHWALADGYAGIEQAQLVVVNQRSKTERGRADALVADVARLRSDADVHRDVIGSTGSKVPITVVVANLLDGKDVGLKKAVARARRAARSGASARA